jgi:hypothetical protein
MQIYPSSLVTPLNSHLFHNIWPQAILKITVSIFWQLYNITIISCLQIDINIYILQDDENFMIIGIYVDDYILINNKLVLIINIKGVLK